MLKIAHVLTGILALLLSLLFSHLSETPFLAHPNAIALTLIGLLNIQMIPSLNRVGSRPKHMLLLVASAMLLLAAAIAAIALFLPPLGSPNQSALLATLQLSFIAVALHLTTTQLNVKGGWRRPGRSPEGLRVSGVVKWFDESRNYGFISRSDGEDVFVHASSLRDPQQRLHEGQNVEFRILQRDKGPQAEDLILRSPQ